MLFETGNQLALYISLAGWALTQLGLMWRYASLRSSATPPVRRNPISFVFFMVASAGLYVVFMPPYAITGDTSGDSARTQIAIVSLLSIFGTWLFWAALLKLGQNFAASAQVREEGHLVTTGPYGLVRNPIYLAYFLLLIASGLALGNLAHLLIGSAVYLFGTAARILIEERVLRAHFGDAYDQYAARVKRLIPFIW